MKKLLLALATTLGIFALLPVQGALAATCRYLTVEPYGTGLRAYCFGGGSGSMRIVVNCGSGYWPYYGKVYGNWVSAVNGFLAATDNNYSSNASCGYGGGLVSVNGSTYKIEYK